MIVHIPSLYRTVIGMAHHTPVQPQLAASPTRFLDLETKIPPRYGVQEIIKVPTSTGSYSCLVLLMFHRSPVWNLYSLPRRLAAEVTRRKRQRKDLPQIAPKNHRREAGEILTREALARMQDEVVRRTFPEEAAGVVEEVVKARRGIWEGLNGRKFFSYHEYLGVLASPVTSTGLPHTRAHASIHAHILMSQD